MLIGPALDGAAQYFDSSNWIGLSTSPITSKILDDYGMENSSHLVKYRVPYKGFIKTCWMLNWVKHEIRKDSEQNSKSILEQESKKYIAEPDVYIKYKNTLQFYKYCQETQ
jgi:hypothetical protein